MTDKLFQNEHEIQEMIDADNKVKEDIIAKHNEDLKVMDSLIYSLNAYIIRFGRTSNIHDECMDLKSQVKRNRDHLKSWIDLI